jgi:hypothetical protein
MSARNGAFLVTMCAYTASWSYALMGATFPALVSAFIAAPLQASIFVHAWILCLVVGAVLVLKGIHEQLVYGEAPPFLFSLAMLLTAAVGLSIDLGGWIGWAIHGLCIMSIAGMSVDVLLSISGFVWGAGYDAGGAGLGTELSRKKTRLIHDQYALISDLMSERDGLLQRLWNQPASRANEGPSSNDKVKEYEEILRNRDVRKAVLRSLHPDSHPHVTEQQRIELTAMFQRASAIFEKLGMFK